MLTFGVEEIEVGLVDSPAGCFGKLGEANKISKIRQLIINDFQAYSEADAPMGQDAEVCHQVIKDVNGTADFTFECCQLIKESGNIKCHDAEDNPYIDALNILIAIIKIAFLLFGPSLVQYFAYSDPGELRKSSYVVKLNQALRKTLLVKKVIVDDSLGSDQQKQMKHFRKFRELLKSIPPDEDGTSEIWKVAHTSWPPPADEWENGTSWAIPLPLLHVSSLWHSTVRTIRFLLQGKHFWKLVSTILVAPTETRLWL